MSQVNNPLPTTSPTTSPSTPEEYYEQWVDQNGIDAEKIRDEGLTAVQRAYDRSSASYGATAEMLRQSGLNNSGLAGLYQNMAETNRRQGNATVYDQYAANVKENKTAFAAHNQGIQSNLFTYSVNTPQATIDELVGIAMNQYGVDEITARQMANNAYNSTVDSRNRYGTSELEKLAQSGGVFDPNKFTYMDNAQGVYDSYRSQYSDVYKQNAANKIASEVINGIADESILDADLTKMSAQEQISLANKYGCTVEELPDVLKLAKIKYNDPEVQASFENRAGTQLDIWFDESNPTFATKEVTYGGNTYVVPDRDTIINSLVNDGVPKSVAERMAMSYINSYQANKAAKDILNSATYSFLPTTAEEYGKAIGTPIEDKAAGGNLWLEQRYGFTNANFDTTVSPIIREAQLKIYEALKTGNYDFTTEDGKKSAASSIEDLFDLKQGAGKKFVEGYLNADPNVVQDQLDAKEEEERSTYNTVDSYVADHASKGLFVSKEEVMNKFDVDESTAQGIIDSNKTKYADTYLSVGKEKATEEILNMFEGLSENGSLADEQIEGLSEKYKDYGLKNTDIEGLISLYEKEDAQNAYASIYEIALSGGALNAQDILDLDLYNSLDLSEIQGIIDDVMAKDDVKLAYEEKVQERAENLATSVGNQIQGGEFKQSNGYLDREAMINDLVENKGYSREEAKLEVKKQVDAETASIFVDKVLNSSAVKWIPYDFRQYVWLNYGNYQEASIEKTKKYLSARFGIPEDDIESFYNSNISPIFAYYAQAIDEGELDENSYGGKFTYEVDRDWIANNTISKAEKQRQEAEQNKTLADNLGSTTNGNGSSFKIAESTTSTMLSGIPTDSPYYSKIKTAEDKGDTDLAMSYAYEYAVESGDKTLQNNVGNRVVSYDLQSMINNGGTIKDDEGDSNVFDLLDEINNGSYNDGSESAKAAQYSIVLDQMSFNVNGLGLTGSEVDQVKISASLGGKDYSMHLSIHTGPNKYSDTLSRQYPNAQNGDFGVTVDDEGRHLSVFYQGSWYWIKKSGATSYGDSITDGEWTYLWEALVET